MRQYLWHFFTFATDNERDYAYQTIAATFVESNTHRHCLLANFYYFFQPTGDTGLRLEQQPTSITHSQSDRSGRQLSLSRHLYTPLTPSDALAKLPFASPSRQPSGRSVTSRDGYPYVSAQAQYSTTYVKPSIQTTGVHSTQHRKYINARRYNDKPLPTSYTYRPSSIHKPREPSVSPFNSHLVKNEESGYPKHKYLSLVNPHNSQLNAPRDQPTHPKHHHLSSSSKRPLEVSSVRFECRGRSGYYGDEDFDCKVFHFCGHDGKRFTFRCGKGLTFDEVCML